MNIFVRLIRKISSVFYTQHGLHKGKNVDIRHRVFFDYPESVYIGDGCCINYGSNFHIGAGDAKIILGNNVFIAMNCTFTTITHVISDETKRAGKNVYKSIVVKDGCWIGAASTILPGVTIAEGCVIAAGSVVTKSTEPNGVYAGVPAKRIKDL